MNNMTYFEAIEAERAEREALIPNGFFNGRPEKSMEDLIKENFELAYNIMERKMFHTQETSDYMLDLFDSLSDGYLPFCFEHSGRTSILNNMAYSTLIHEYNLWVLNDYLNDKIAEVNYISMKANTDRIDELTKLETN